MLNSSTSTSVVSPVVSVCCCVGVSRCMSLESFACDVKLCCSRVCLCACLPASQPCTVTHRCCCLDYTVDSRVKVEFLMNFVKVEFSLCLFCLCFLLFLLCLPLLVFFSFSLLSVFLPFLNLLLPLHLSSYPSPPTSSCFFPSSCT